MHKNLKRFLIVLLILVIGYFIVDYAIFKLGEFFFKTEIINAEEVAGKTDNNKLGIRNDVYDVIQKEYVEKMNLNEEEKILIYNLAYIDQKLLENFTDESEVLKYERLWHLSLFCKFKKFTGVFEKMNSNSIYGKKLHNTQIRNNARIVFESIMTKKEKTKDKKTFFSEDCIILDSLLVEQGL